MNFGEKTGPGILRCAPQNAARQVNIDAKHWWNTINKNIAITGGLKEQVVIFICYPSATNGMSRTGLPGLKVGLMIPVGSWQKAASPCDLFRGCSVVVLPSGHQQKLFDYFVLPSKRVSKNGN